MASIPIDNIPAIQPPQPVSPLTQAKPSYAQSEEYFHNHLQSSDNPSTATDGKLNRPKERPPAKDESNNDNIANTSNPTSSAGEKASTQGERDDATVENQKETSTNDSDKPDSSAEINDLTDEVLLEIDHENNPQDSSEVEILFIADKTVDLPEQAPTEPHDESSHVETLRVQDSLLEETAEESKNALNKSLTTDHPAISNEATSQTTTPNHISAIDERLAKEVPEDSANAEATLDIETTQKIDLGNQPLKKQNDHQTESTQPKQQTGDPTKLQNTAHAQAQAQPTRKTERITQQSQTEKTPEMTTKSVHEETTSLALESITDSTTRETKVDPASSPPPLPTSTAGAAPAHSRLTQQIFARSGEQNSRLAPISSADQARFIQRVAKAFEAAQSRDGEIRLRLSPPELGSLRLEVKVQGGVMTARIEAETSTVRSLLLDNMPVLRERLAEQGIRLEQFDVDLTDRQPGGLPENGPENKDDNDHNAPQLKAEQNDETDSLTSSSINNSTDSPDDGRLNVVV